VSKILGQREQVPAKSLSAPIHSVQVSSCEGIVEIDVNGYGMSEITLLAYPPTLIGHTSAS
jgi:hypothetical protein